MFMHTLSTHLCENMKLSDVQSITILQIWIIKIIHRNIDIVSMTKMKMRLDSSCWQTHSIYNRWPETLTQTDMCETGEGSQSDRRVGREDGARENREEQGGKYQSRRRDVSFGTGDYAVFGTVWLWLCRTQNSVKGCQWVFQGEIREKYRERAGVIMCLAVRENSSKLQRKTINKKF